MRLDDALETCPVVAILRGIRPAEVQEHVAILYESGVRAVEIPLNSPDPLESISRLAKTWQGRMTVGAGTVLQAADVTAVADAGGAIIVAPNTNPAVISRAIELGLTPAPGFATASEAFQALAQGARHLKLFPAAPFGTTYLKQVKVVLPDDAVIWAVGGVGTDDMRDWYAAGARVFGLGSVLYKAGQSAAETAAKAQAVANAVRALRDD